MFSTYVIFDVHMDKCIHLNVQNAIKFQLIVLSATLQSTIQKQNNSTAID